jgi:hypothetical protein
MQVPGPPSALHAPEQQSAATMQAPPDVTQEAQTPPVGSQ